MIKTKLDFLDAYDTELRERYVWAMDVIILHAFLYSTLRTLIGDNTWNFKGPAVTAAWRSIGGKGTPTLKALRSLGYKIDGR